MIPIISITGTKGKTSVARALDAVAQSKFPTVLRVDTEGAWLNGVLKVTDSESRSIWGLASANAPGRFMMLLHGIDNDRLAILEANLFSSKACGLGYSTHKVGVFTNVYEDHIGSDQKIQNSADIAEAKSFIFHRIAQDGYAVFNADNKWVTSQLPKIPTDKNITRIACSLEKTIVPDAEVSFCADGENIVMNSAGATKNIAKFSDFAMHLPGFEPSNMNILLVIAALFGINDGKITETLITQFKNYLPSEEDGRMVVYQSEAGPLIIFDFAHEKQSLKQVAQFARKHAKDGKVIGVIRISHTRTDKLIDETAKAIAVDYDAFMVYDKIDGILRKPNKNLNPFKEEVIGRTSKVLTESLKKHGAKSVIREISEEKALQKALKVAGENDVLVYIQGNNPRQSLDFLKKNTKKLSRITQ